MSTIERIRVGYLLKRYPRYSETFIVNEILAHEAAGMEVEIFALYPPCDTHFQDTIASVQAPVHYLPNAGIKITDFWEGLGQAGADVPQLWNALAETQDEAARDVFQAALIASQVLRRRIDHLHAHFASLATNVARLAARFAQVPYSFTAHAKDIFHESVSPSALRCKLRDAAAVITVSDFNLQYLDSKLGSDAARVQRIYNGLDLKRFPYRDPEERPPRIISVGRLVEKKGFTDLIEACAILADRGCAFECWIIGTGELEAELHRQIELLALQARVKLLGPHPQREVIRMLQQAAVFAAPCVLGADGNRDGLPTVLLEAMALGTPCVSTDVTGIPEVVIDGETGIMIPQHDPDRLARALEQLLKNPPLRVELARHARRLIEAEFDITSNAAALRNVFQASVGAETELVQELG